MSPRSAKAAPDEVLPALDIARVQALTEQVLALPLYWFPVRHHSPAAARHLRAAMRARKPKLVLIEGPADANALIPHVIDGKTKPPIALYSSYRDDGNVLGLAGIASAAPDIPARFPVWYPLLSYSPEYVAMVEAQRLGAEAVFIDLPHHALIDADDWKGHARPAANPAADDDEDDRAAAGDQPERHTWEAFVAESSFFQTMAKAAGYRTWDEAWDSLFEVGRRHPTHEEFRRDLAYFCAAVRATASPARLERDGTNARERFMRQTIEAELTRRGLDPSEAMVVCGGFHLFLDRDDAAAPPPIPEGTCLSTVVPFSNFQVSELSGYGAGNRAPRYYQTVWEHLEDPEPWVGAMVEHVTSVLAKGRKEGEALSAADAISVTQHARLLASLRGRAAPILDDLRDALISCCCKGRPEEEGRGLLKAMTAAEVGSAIGRVTPALGRLPIVHDFHAQLDALDLGEVMGREKKLRITLDLREEQGARRSAFLHRLQKLEIPLGALEEGSGDGATLFREKWALAWAPKVETSLIERNAYGDSIESAAMARLEEDVAKEQRHAGNTCLRLRESVAMQLPRLLQRLEHAAGAAIDEDRHFGSQCEALVHLLVLDRLAVQGNLGREALATLATRAYARGCLAIGELGALPADQQEPTIAHLKSLAEAVLGGQLGLDRALFTDAARGAALAATTPFMQGAFAGILTELRELDPHELADRIAAFARSQPAKMVLAGEFLDGAFAVSKTSMLLGAEALVSAIDALLRAAPWEDFMTLVPRVRHAFERLHERQRMSFADRVAARYGLTEAQEVLEVKATSEGAALYLATVDARVAAIMKEWTF